MCPFFHGGPCFPTKAPAGGFTTGAPFLLNVAPAPRFPMGVPAGGRSPTPPFVECGPRFPIFPRGKGRPTGAPFVECGPGSPSPASRRGTGSDGPLCRITKGGKDSGGRIPPVSPCGTVPLPPVSGCTVPHPRRGSFLPRRTGDALCALAPARAKGPARSAAGGMPGNALRCRPDKHPPPATHPDKPSAQLPSCPGPQAAGEIPKGGRCPLLAVCGGCKGGIGTPLAVFLFAGTAFLFPRGKRNGVHRPFVPFSKGVQRPLLFGRPNPFLFRKEKWVRIPRPRQGNPTRGTNHLRVVCLQNIQLLGPHDLGPEGVQNLHRVGELLVRPVGLGLGNAAGKGDGLGRADHHVVVRAVV